MNMQVMEDGVLRDATADEIDEVLARHAINLDAMKVAAIAKAYTDVDAVIGAAIGNRAEEYKDAEAAAREYLVSGGEGDADVAVSSYAMYNPTGELQTNAWAAKQIIQRADAFRAAQKAMRAERFARQAEMRMASTKEELAVAVDSWQGFISNVFASLEL